MTVGGGGAGASDLAGSSYAGYTPNGAAWTQPMTATLEEAYDSSEYTGKALHIKHLLIFEHF